MGKRRLGWIANPSLQHFSEIMDAASKNREDETLRILVTGGSGFVGSQVVRQLRESGIQVTSLYRSRNADLCAEDNIRMDLTDVSTASLMALLGDHDVVVHCYWPVASSDYLFSNENYLAGRATVRLAECSLKAGVRRFIGVGTCLEYDTSFGLLNVTTPTSPSSKYGEVKLRTFEELSSIFKNTSLSFAWARLFFIFGEGDREHRFPAYVYNQVRRDLPAIVRNPALVRDYLDVREVGRQLASLALSKIEGPLNICSGRPTSLLRLAVKIAAQFGREDLIVSSTERETQRETELVPRIVGVPSLIYGANFPG